ncbi:MAG: hypothetical protein GXY33_02560 [Phycisphaerae bacterium]|nr:hypothetical protein [Phycisphaerae bacterium]
MAKAAKKQVVDRTRLTWVLAVLVASMTIGAVFLGVLEPNRALSAEAKYLAATYNASPTSRTQTPINKRQWDAVVIHRVGSDLRLSCLAHEHTGVAPAVHFAISPQAETLVTSQWENQRDVTGYPGKIQIGIQLAPGQTHASHDQAKAVVNLLRDLQARCNVPAHKIYLHSQLSNRACHPDPLECYNWRKPLLN